MINQGSVAGRDQIYDHSSEVTMWGTGMGMGQNPGTVPWTPSHSWVKMDVNNPQKMYL